MPFKIVIDSREKAPYEFDCETVCKALPAGDYSIEGLEEIIAIERKTIDDFVISISKNRDRFKREIKKLSLYEKACVVIESSYKSLIIGSYRSKMNPNSVNGTLLSIILDYNIPIYCCTDRHSSTKFVKTYLNYFYRRRAKDNEP